MATNGTPAPSLEDKLRWSVALAQQSPALAGGFRPAVKRNAKARIALCGIAGSGKRWTALTFAGFLGKKTAAVDTEHGSLSKYADQFSFDVIEPSSYNPESLLTLIDVAEASGCEVFLVDSLSHYWMGKDGALEFVDNATKRSGTRDSWNGWREFTPIERRIIDRMLSSSMHIIVTMRVKTAYEETADDKGRKRRVKIGLEPVQRAGLEYEFDLVGTLDEDNTLIIDKTRCLKPTSTFPAPISSSARTAW
jgi:hypothetical protein